MSARIVPAAVALASDTDAPSLGWMARAACADSDSRWFFMNEGKGNGYDAKRRYCVQCPVDEECLTYAIVNRLQAGVWGGMNAKERRLETYRRKRQKEYPFNGAGRVVAET